MNVELFNLPKLDKKNFSIVEKTYCDILNKYHVGTKLNEEILDWMDSANVFLHKCDNMEFDNERS